MIIASENLKIYIETLGTVEKAAKHLDVHPNTIRNILDGKPISSEIIAGLLLATGFSFDKAFVFDQKYLDEFIKRRKKGMDLPSSY